VADIEAIPTDSLAWRPQAARPSRRSRPVRDPVIEPHWQGAHVLVHLDADRRAADGGTWCVILDEYGDDVTGEEPAVAAAVRAAVRAGEAVLDGFLTDQATRSGTTVSALPIARRTGNIVMGHRLDTDVAPPQDDGAVRPVAFVAVDLLRVDGQELFDIPLLERKRILDSLLEEGDLVRISPYTRPPVEPWMRTWRAAGFDGVMLKAANSRYRPGGETDDWTISLAVPTRR
jgi:ATP dependent DNA ligase domain